MITIDLAPRSANGGLSTSGLSRFLNRARLAVGLRGEVDVLLTGDSTLRQLNKTFRAKNKPTDVLSFPAPSEFAEKHAGDLAISLETAARQATTYGHTLRDEIKARHPPRPPPPLRRRPRNRQRRDGRPRSHPPPRTPRPHHAYREDSRRLAQKVIEQAFIPTN